MMKKLFLTVAAFLVLAVQAAFIEIVTTEERSYRIGEEITFKVTAYESKDKLMTAGKFTIKLSAGTKVLEAAMPVDLAKSNPFTFKAKLDRPGFILAKASDYTLPDNRTVKWQNHRDLPPAGGAAIEPEKIRQGGTVPADFQQFWQDGLKEFEKAKVEVVRAKELDFDGYKVSRITVHFPDNSGFIDGFLSIPEKPGKYPAIAGVPGAGQGVIKPQPYIRGSKPAIWLFINIFPFRTASTVAEQIKLYNEFNKILAGKRRYFHVNTDDREKYHFRKVWLALSRAVDYTAALPEFDGKNFAASGNSQGGGTALALGYLNKKITCVAASVPAFCDHQGHLLGRVPGSPKLHLGLPGRKHAAMPYFDGAAFASFIKVPTIISVGYVDEVCYPSSVYAAYNNLKGEKKLCILYRCGHRNNPASRKELGDFIDQQFSKK